jgi:hypothetical protein
VEDKSSIEKIKGGTIMKNKKLAGIFAVAMSLALVGTACGTNVDYHVSWRIRILGRNNREMPII